MPTRVSLFGRVFAPSWPMTLLTLALLGLFASLGQWQWNKGAAKQAVWDEYQRNAAARTSGGESFSRARRFARISLTGEFDPLHQFLLDNRSQDGAAGYEVLTPFASEGRWVLVNRGWIRFEGFRDRLPDVSMPPVQTVTITGRVDHLPASGLDSGRAAPSTDTSWPKLTSFPAHAELEAALGQKLEPGMLLLDAEVVGGFARNWKPPGMAPERHLAYAIQWWAFAALLLVLYFSLNLRKVP